jgi:LysM repeat protein
MKLAYTFNQSIPVLKRMNNLISDELYPGQILKISLPSDAEVLMNP